MSDRANAYSHLQLTRSVLCIDHFNCKIMYILPVNMCSYSWVKSLRILERLSLINEFIHSQDGSKRHGLLMFDCYCKVHNDELFEPVFHVQSNNEDGNIDKMGIR